MVSGWNERLGEREYYLQRFYGKVNLGRVFRDVAQKKLRWSDGIETQLGTMEVATMVARKQVGIIERPSREVSVQTRSRGHVSVQHPVIGALLNDCWVGSSLYLLRYGRQLFVRFTKV